MTDVLRIGHFSDTHFGWRSSSAVRTRRVLDHLAAMEPPLDVLLLSGDVADHGTPEEYAEAGRVLADWAGPAPLLMLPGNHDVRSAYAAWQGISDDGRPLHRAVDVSGVLFCLLDSMVPAPPGQRIDHGELDEESLAWLDEQLADRPQGQRAVVCLHHPPVDIHQSQMDPIRLRDPDAGAFAEVLARHPGVLAVLCGHIHSACATTVGSVPVLAGGGVASTVTLDEEELPFITATLPPTFAVHLIGDDDRVVTHWRAV